MPLASIVLEKGGPSIVELALHQAVHQMDKRHFHACLGKAISRLYAEQAAADHRRAGARPHQGAHRADIREIAEGEDVLQIHAGLRQSDRKGAGREHELRKGKALAVHENDHPAPPVDRGDRLSIERRHGLPTFLSSVRRCAPSGLSLSLGLASALF